MDYAKYLTIVATVAGFILSVFRGLSLNASRLRNLSDYAKDAPMHFKLIRDAARYADTFGISMAEAAALIGEDEREAEEVLRGLWRWMWFYRVATVLFALALFGTAFSLAFVSDGFSEPSLVIAPHFLTLLAVALFDFLMAALFTQRSIRLSDCIRLTCILRAQPCKDAGARPKEMAAAEDPPLVAERL